MEILLRLSIALVASLGTYIIYKKKIIKRINELRCLIENLNQNNYQINLNQDEFSKLEDDIYKLFLQIVEQRENIEKLYKSQSKNLEDIAHQIKTPITSILFQLENLEDKEDENMENIKRQLTRLNNLTDILLKLSSLDVNINQMKKENIKIDEIVEYSLDILEGDIKKIM